MEERGGKAGEASQTGGGGTQQGFCTKRQCTFLYANCWCYRSSSKHCSIVFQIL